MKTSRKARPRRTSKPPIARPFATSEWATVQEARVYLGGSVTREFLSRAVNRGLIPAYRVGFDVHVTGNVDRRPLRFRKQDLDDFLLNRRVVVALVEPRPARSRSKSSSAAAPAA